MTKQKINIRKNRLSSGRTQKHKDFNSLYGTYQQGKQAKMHKKRLTSIVLGASFLVIILAYGIFLVEKNKEFEFDSLSEHKIKNTEFNTEEGLVDLLELPDTEKISSEEPVSENPASEPEFKNRIATYSDNSDSSDVVAVFYIEKPAQPVEGFDAFYQNYIKKNLIYPEEAKERRLRGKVYLQFVVEKDGSIANIEVMSGLIPACNQEAVRIMQNSPKWKAATFKHGTARQTIAMPITFGEE